MLGAKCLNAEAGVAEEGWVQKTESGVPVQSSRKRRVLALKCHCVSLDTQAFPKKNRDAQTGEADN